MKVKVKQKRLSALDEERKREYFRNYYQEHREEILAQSKEYREKNKEKCAAAYKNWAEANREKRVASSRKWAAAHPDKVKLYAKRQQEKRKERKANGEEALVVPGNLD